MLIRNLVAGAATGVLVLALCSTAAAQEITGGVAGHVTEDGKPVSGAQIKVTNVGTGVSIETTTGSDGFYSISNLPVGGPYKVVATAPDNVTETTQVGSIPLGAPYQLDVALGGAQVSEVT
ncbi:MAG TPA: carboxypeptidase-like regulatory domain-containing protein, partial [Caulobacteraceae bacterium]|nr:carboxypeptidase-like regulatory domain-containing protein [Caulobacteraceae bacterium]